MELIKWSCIVNVQCSEFFWYKLMGIWKKRWLETVTVDLLKMKYAWPAQLASLINWLDFRISGRVAAHVIDFSKALLPQYSFFRIRILWCWWDKSSGCGKVRLWSHSEANWRISYTWKAVAGEVSWDLSCLISLPIPARNNREHCIQVCRWHQIRVTSWYSWGQGHHPERLREAVEMGLQRSLRNFRWTDVKSCIWQGIRPCSDSGWCLSGWEQLCSKGHGTLAGTSWAGASNISWLKGQPAAPWAVSTGAQPGQQGK